EVLDAGADEGEGATFVEGQRLLRRPTHALSAGLRGQLAKGLSMGGDVRRVGDRADRDFVAFPAEPVDLPAYTVVDLSATAQVLRAGSGRPGFELTLRLDNVLDQEYQEVLGFRAPGRGIYLGGTLHLGPR
ncbi:MAG: TonB-dependent receptor, partial [Gemmatimonadetes bacterium]|nr:TonB-dependent receptor [Gemmatimonadota bacterium]